MAETPFVNKSTYQPPKARKVSFFCNNWRMQIAATWCERAGFAHSRATCQRTQIYGEYTGGTIIIRLMHSSRGAHNLKLVAQVAILHCESSSLYLSEEFRDIMRSLVILFLSFCACVCVCFIYREGWARFFQFDWQSYGSIVERMTKRFFTLVEDLLIFFSRCVLDGFVSFWEKVKGIRRRRDDRFWFASKSSENKWIIFIRSSFNPFVKFFEMNFVFWDGKFMIYRSGIYFKNSYLFYE